MSQEQRQPGNGQPGEGQPEETQPARPDNDTAYEPDQDREPPAAGTPGESNTWAMPDVHTRDAAVDRPDSDPDS